MPTGVKSESKAPLGTEDLLTDHLQNAYRRFSQNVTSIAKLDVSGYRSSLVIATAENVQIGRIESLQKLHVRTLRLGSEAPRRICYSKKLRAFGVVFLRETLDRSTGDISRQSSFKVLDETTFDGEQSFGIFRKHSLELWTDLARFPVSLGGPLVRRSRRSSFCRLPLARLRDR